MKDANVLRHMLRVMDIACSSVANMKNKGAVAIARVSNKGHSSRKHRVGGQKRAIRSIRQKTPADTGAKGIIANGADQAAGSSQLCCGVDKNGWRAGGIRPLKQLRCIKAGVCVNAHNLA